MLATNTRARIGLTARVKSSYPLTNGPLTMGLADQEVNLTATHPYVLRVIMADSGIYGFDLDGPGTIEASTTAFTAGTAQVETATAAGSITTSGNMTVTVTAAGMTGSPKAISVAVTSGDTAATWAGKVRTALAADADVSAMFTVSGSTTAIVLTRKPTHTFTVPDGDGGTTSLYFYAANDGTLNIALADDTSDGVTEAATSANTTSGVATAGAKAYRGSGSANFEGISELTGLINLSGLYIGNALGIVSYVNSVSTEKGVIQSGSSGAHRLFLAEGSSPLVVDDNSEWVFTATDGPVDLTIIVFANAA